MIAEQRRGSVNVAAHCENGALVATAIEERSSLSVMTWNNSSAPQGVLVLGFDEFVDEAGCGCVAHGESGVARGDTGADEEVGFACA